MKNFGTTIITALICLFTAMNALASDGAEIKLDGIFRGENLFVKNPFAPSGVGFCIYEITVNGQVATDEINSSAFEINLSMYHLKEGDPINVVIKHKEGCTPKVLNPEVLKPKSTFNIANFTVDKTGKVVFSTKDEKGSLPFIVEQFKWKKWVNVGQVNGKGTSALNNYSVNIILHTGINKIRIKQVDCTNKPRYSNEVTINNAVQEVTFKPGNNGVATSQITFSRNTDYEIYDFYGKRVAKGNGTTVNVAQLPKGTYFVNYDCKSESFEKK